MSRWTDFLFVVGAMIATASLPYFGFCSATGQFLSDGQAIDAAIGEVLTLAVHAVELPRGDFMNFSPDKPVRYLTREEFLRVNPDCCKIVPHDRLWIGFHHQVLGCAAKSVHVRYMVRYISEFGTVSLMEAQAQRAIGNCGHVLNTDH